MENKLIKTDEVFMQRALDLALMGRSYVSPNPLVGCVIVKNGKIIAQGYHEEFGAAHAEVNAIANCKQNISGSTVYINLEPCFHRGKTPPCVDLLIEHKVRRVVCGTLDPNPLVNGKSITKLKKAGIKTTVGVLANLCEQVNEKFFKFMRTGEPFVTLKIAQTLDGKISSGKKDKNKITNELSRLIVHAQRAEHDAVLIGDGTAKSDDPELTVRLTDGRQPYRVILNPDFDISLKSKIFTDNYSNKTILFVSDSAYKEKHALVEKLIKKEIKIYPLQVNDMDFFPIKKVINILKHMGISSIFVEGGSKIFSSFLKENLVDKLILFFAPKLFGTGVDSLSKEITIKPIVLYDYIIHQLDKDFVLEANLKNF